MMEYDAREEAWLWQAERLERKRRQEMQERRCMMGALAAVSVMLALIAFRVTYLMWMYGVCL